MDYNMEYLHYDDRSIINNEMYRESFFVCCFQEALTPGVLGTRKVQLRIHEHEQ